MPKSILAHVRVHCVTVVCAASMIVCLPTASTAKPPVVCYVETLFGGAQVGDLDLDLCSHVIETFVLVDAESQLSMPAGRPRKELLRRSEKLGAVPLLSFAGATQDSKIVRRLISSTSSRRALAEKLARYVRQTGYQGLDVDWEFPSYADRAVFLAFVEELRIALDSTFADRATQPVLTATISTGYWLPGYDLRRLSEVLDYAIYMGYDFRNPSLAPWKTEVGLWIEAAEAPIESSVQSIASQIVNRGMDRNKLLIGIPFYTSDHRPWTEVRKHALSTGAPLHNQFGEKNAGDYWFMDAEAIEERVRRSVSGNEILGGPVAGVAIWQLGQQGRGRGLTDGVRRGLKPKP